jgi:hypothetical protein
MSHHPPELDLLRAPLQEARFLERLGQRKAGDTKPEWIVRPRGEITLGRLEAFGIDVENLMPAPRQRTRKLHLKRMTGIIVDKNAPCTDHASLFNE